MKHDLQPTKTSRLELIVWSVAAVALWAASPLAVLWATHNRPLFGYLFAGALAVSCLCFLLIWAACAVSGRCEE